MQTREKKYIFSIAALSFDWNSSPGKRALYKAWFDDISKLYKKMINYGRQRGEKKKKSPGKWAKCLCFSRFHWLCGTKLLCRETKAQPAGCATLWEYVCVQACVCVTLCRARTSTPLYGFPNFSSDKKTKELCVQGGWAFVLQLFFPIDGKIK